MRSSMRMIRLRRPLKRGRLNALRQFLSNPTGRTTPVFLVGCGRSGTSMLLHHLGRSWAVDPFNENNPLAFQNFRLVPLDVIAGLVDRSYARAAIFKPVLTTSHSCEYLDRFPDARLIFVYRDYRDVVNSSLKRFGPADRLAHVNAWISNDFAEFAPISPPEQTRTMVRQLWKPDLSPASAAALYWLFQNQLFFDLNLQHEARVMLVNYESLVADAVREIERVCAFLNLRYEPVMADDIFATSVGRDEEPVLDPDIDMSCEMLFRQLQDATGKRSG